MQMSRCTPHHTRLVARSVLIGQRHFTWGRFPNLPKRPSQLENRQVRKPAPRALDSSQQSGAVQLALAFSLALVFATIFASIGRAAETPEDLLKGAQQLEQSGNLQRAATLYQDYLAKFPGHVQVTATHYRLAKCYDELGMVEESMAQLQKVLQSDDKKFRNRPDAFYMLAKHYASMKDYENAAGTFEAMLAEGAGLYEDEVLNLCGGYYALLGKHNEAAAKLNILTRKTDSPLAEEAAYKLAVLWLRTGRTKEAVEAIQDLARRFPKNKQIPELLLRAADLFRTQKKYDQTIALCEQLKARYPKNTEALAGRYLVGLCYRDRKEFEKAAEVLDEVGRAGEAGMQTIAAEAMMQSADIYYLELADTPKAIRQYEEAAKLVRGSGGDRANQILEQCYFRLAEYYFQKKNWSVALENYLLLRQTGSKLNVLGRILACQAKLEEDRPPPVLTDQDVEVVEAKIAANPGTAVAAEAELFLLDRKLADAVQRKDGLAEVAEQYRALLTKYRKDVLATDHMESYVYAQIGSAYARGQAKGEWLQAIEAYEQAVRVDPAAGNPYKIPSLENLALVAERAGDKPRAVRAYNELLDIAQQKLDRKPDDRELERQTLSYLKSLVTRSDTDDLIQSSLEMCREMIRKRGQLSELSREARFYLGELYYLKKDFSTAVKAYREFIRIYGPKQDAKGDLVEAPWKPPSVDDKVRRLQEAALRIAHCWYLQSHDQNMVEAYRWIVRNMPHDNLAMAEAQYWLALELGKGQRGKTAEGKRAMADALWKNVVNSSTDFRSGEFDRSFHFWVNAGDPRYAEVQPYVKTAFLRAAVLYGELKDHHLAAAILEQYVKRYPRRPAEDSLAPGQSPDETYDMAHYALNRQYVALGDVFKLVESAKVYVVGMRESKFRVSALKLLGFHAGQGELYQPAVEAYATLLDEYGTNDVDANNNPIPLPREKQLRTGGTNWNGIRLPVPKDLDQGEIRFALGFLYWKQRNWGQCVKALSPFLDDPRLARNKSRDKALYMLGRSYYELDDYAKGAKAIQTLLRDHPRFEAVQEAYVYAARGLTETKAWGDLDLVYRRFVAEWPQSPERPRMDLYAALSLIGQDQADRGAANLKSLAGGDTFEDVKADACYYLALRCLEVEPPNRPLALQWFEMSVSIYPRETACLDAAKCCIELKQWPKARQLLSQVLRNFPQGNPRVLNEARNLMPEVLKQMAKDKER